VLGGQTEGQRERQKEGQKDGQKGRQKEGQKKGRRRGRRAWSRGQWLSSGSLLLIRWRLISGVERGESFRVRRRFGRGFSWF
jgi:hypothetical protein